MNHSVESRSTAPVVLTTSPEQMRAQIRKSAKLKGRQADELSRQEVRALIGDAPEEGHPAHLLIEYLHLLQDQYLALFERHLCALAKEMNLPMAHVFEVASFYHHFEIIKDEAQPQPVVRVCAGLSCEIAGAKDLMATLSQQLDLAGWQLQAAPCVGRCEQAPAAVVHQHAIGWATAKQVLQATEFPTTTHPSTTAAKNAFDPALMAEKSITENVMTQQPDTVEYDLYVQQGGYQLATELALHQPEKIESIIATLEQSGLRGLGGAGFPAGRKWRIVRDQAAPKLMAINIDEGEPGTFKDRTYLERDPHRFLEGALIAAYCVGIEKIYIYLRDEYHGARAILQKAINDLNQQAVQGLKANLPSIELRRGAGAYICGEESAMIESLEGKRGEPRMRPPYIAQVGLFGRPTLEHNFETLYWVRSLVEKGADWFTGFGRNGRKGLRSYSLSGRVKKPGVKLAPAGITVQELINEYGGGMLDGHELYAYLPGGASGGILPASMNNIPLDFDTLQPYGCFIGSAAVIVLSQHDTAKDAARNMMQFFADESCGQCTPCRVGTEKVHHLVKQDHWDQDTLHDLSTVMIDASICGLGQAAPNPVLSVMKYFPAEVGAK
jgi:formate dehydrogenase